MTRFIRKIFIALIPLLIYFIIIVVIDPFNYFKITRLISDDIKLRTSFSLNPPLWKILRYKDKPTENILLGDSRVDLFNVDTIYKETKKIFFNLSYGGGSLKEAIETFWLISKIKRLKNVYIGINFNLYNLAKSKSRIKEVETINRNMFTYAFCQPTVTSLYYILKSMIFKNQSQIGTPDMNREEFWKFQLNTSAKMHYNFYSYPKEYYSELLKISKFCQNNKINLVLFIPPTHVELQKRIDDFHLRNEEKRFKEDLKSVATLYDFDYPTELTRNKENFADPFHIKKGCMISIIKDLFGNDSLRYSKCYKITIL